MNQQKIAASIVGAALLVGLFIILRSHPASVSDTTFHQQLLATENSLPTEAGKKNFLKRSYNLTQRVDAELVDLDSQIISCDANVDGLASGAGTMSGSCIDSSLIPAQSVKGKFMGGQCCSAMTDTVKYHEHLQKLQAYKSIPDIPLDPMHTPVEMAKKWIDYDKNTTLTPTEQKMYDDVYAISMEKPCCCKCWHYYTNEGIAKKMIKDGVWNAQQIAAYWDSSDICGA
ncbi:MAG: hypothetical protein HY093_01305 [Candidatus Liptonbacteria bacterium]|nr:hypothetical protein [Candidatus Liptonbacteria bacterium]